MLSKNIMYKTKLLADFLQGELIDMAAAMIAVQLMIKILEGNQIKRGGSEP